MNIQHFQAAGNVALDPDQNISVISVSGLPYLPKKAGHYRRQYLAASLDGSWGTRHGGCGTRTMFRRDGEVLRIIPALCAQWACTLCGPMRAAWLKRELKLAQEKHRLNYFWTLTIWTKTMPAQWSDVAITLAWNKLNEHIRQKYGAYSYVWLREHTQRGYAHLHLLTSLDIIPAKLSKAWSKASGGSYIVDVQPVETERAADYLAKYCTQEATARREPGNEHLKHKRLFSCSRDIKFAPFRAPAQRIAHLDEETGEIKLRSPWKILDRPYWGERKRLRMVHGPPIIERILGQPAATFAAACP